MKSTQSICWGKKISHHVHQVMANTDIMSQEQVQPYPFESV